MDHWRKSSQRKRRNAKARDGKLSNREIHADQIHNLLNTLKKNIEDLKTLHRIWQKDKNFDKVNAQYERQVKEFAVNGEKLCQDLHLSKPSDDRLKARINELVREQDSLEYDLEESKAERRDLKRKLKQYLGEKEDSMPKRPATSPADGPTNVKRVTRSDQLENERDQLKQERDQLKKGIESYKQDNQTLSQRRAKADREVNDMRGKLQNRDETIEGLHQQIKQCESEYKALQEGQKQDRSFQQQEENLQKTTDKLSAELQANDEAFTSFRQQAQSEEEKLQASIDKLQKKSLSECHARDEALTSVRQQAQSKEENLQASIDKLQKKLLSERHEKDEALARFQQQAKSKEGSLRSTIDKLQNNLSSERHAKDDALLRFQQQAQSKEGSLRSTIDKLQNNLSSERHAKDDALLRLSAMAGSKLRDNNPAITDLSDPNRPMKLAEKVSELYDNEWTNAMENLENMGIEEQPAITILIEIVAKVFTDCEEMGNAQTDFITSMELIIAVPDIDDLREAAKSLVDNKQLAKLQSEITKPLKDYRKQSCLVVSPLLCQKMRARLNTLHGLDDNVLEACDEFINSTVTYVWMMRVQDPPVHMEWDFKHGDKFDHDRLRSYTKGGDKVDYVVWPILYLHKGGPMLAKGVAQGMKTKPK